MDKRRVEDFDPDVCHGNTPGTVGVCPHREAAEADTGRPIIDRLARLEGFAIGAATGDDQHKCGLCGCNLPNLSATNMAPVECPRIEQHDGA